MVQQKTNTVRARHDFMKSRNNWKCATGIDFGSLQSVLRYKVNASENSKQANRKDDNEGNIQGKRI